MTTPPIYPDFMISSPMHQPTGLIYSKIPNIKYSILPMKTARISIIFSPNSPSLSPLRISELYADYVLFKYPIFGKPTELMTDCSLTTLDSYNEYTKNIILDNATLLLQ
jgi:hypothetical protein